MRSLNRGSDAQKLTAGMPEEAVINLLGKPYKRERWGDTEFLMFETNYLSFSSAGRFTPVAVVGGKVVAWDQAYYDQIVQARKRWNTQTQ